MHYVSRPFIPKGNNMNAEDALETSNLAFREKLGPERVGLVIMYSVGILNNYI